MSWFGWLILLAGLYLLIVLLRGTIQLVSWLVQEYIIEPELPGIGREDRLGTIEALLESGKGGFCPGHVVPFLLRLPPSV